MNYYTINILLFALAMVLISPIIIGVSYIIYHFDFFINIENVFYLIIAISLLVFYCSILLIVTAAMIGIVLDE